MVVDWGNLPKRHLYTARESFCVIHALPQSWMLISSLSTFPKNINHFSLTDSLLRSKKKYIHIYEGQLQNTSAVITAIPLLNFELVLNEEEVPCDVTIHRHSLLLRYVDNYSFDYYLNNRSYRISDLKRIHILYWAQIVPLLMKNSHWFDYIQGVSHLTVIWFP